MRATGPARERERKGGNLLEISKNLSCGAFLKKLHIVWMLLSLAQLLFKVSLLSDRRLDEKETSSTSIETSLKTQSLRKRASFCDMEIFVKKFEETNPFVSSLSFLLMGLSPSSKIRSDVFPPSDKDSLRARQPSSLMSFSLRNAYNIIIINKK